MTEFMGFIIMGIAIVFMLSKCETVGTEMPDPQFTEQERQEISDALQVNEVTPESEEVIDEILETPLSDIKPVVIPKKYNWRD